MHEAPQFTSDGRAINAAAVHHQVNEARRQRLEVEAREAQLEMFPISAGHHPAPLQSS